jgi:hypothetical protein
MLKLMSYADQQKLVAAQQKDLNFDWYSHRSADQEKLMAVADTVYELVTDTVTAVNPIPYLFDTKSGELGKKIAGIRNYGGKVYERSYGEYKRVSVIKSESFTMTTKAKALHFSVSVEELKAGVITLAELAEMASTAILYNKIKNAWDTLVAACAGSAYHTDCGTTLTEATVDTVLRTKKDTWGSIAGIWGRNSLLDYTWSFSGVGGSAAGGFPETMKEELYRQGMLSVYRGVPIMGIPDFSDEISGTSAISATECFIIASGKKKFNRYCEVTPVTQSTKVEPLDGTFHLVYDFEDGFALWKAKYVHKLAAA